MTRKMLHNFFREKSLNLKEIHKQTRYKAKFIDNYVNEYLRDDAVYASDLSECSTSLAHSSYPPGYCLALKEEQNKTFYS